MTSGDTIDTSTKPFPVLQPDGHRGGHSSHTPKHNSHPYAIKTTSTALLSRTNSTGNRLHTHSYLPTSPCSSPSQRHRFTKSESVVIGHSSILPASPRPLPTPPSFESPTKSISDNRNSGRVRGNTVVRTWRANSEKTHHNASPPPSPVKVDDLPSNPKVWSTTQLSSYLITALRVRNGNDLPIPPPVAKDIVAFVKDAKLTGRTFLKLSEYDLEQMGVNHLWRTALINTSRHLRQNVLRGRIWGFDDDENTQSPFSHSLYNSSSSSVESIASLDSTPLKNVRRNGRVRGMVEHLERSASMSSNSSSGSFKEAVANNSDPFDEEAIASDGEVEVGEIYNGPSVITPRGAFICASPKRDSRSLPPMPLQVPSVDLANGVTAVSQPSEPSVHELLSSDEMSKSWGARAWEEFDVAAGETMKRLDDIHSGAVDKASIKAELSGSNSGRGAVSVGQGRIKATELFPNSRPLPTPPGSRATCSDSQQTPTKSTKKHQGVQAGVEAVITVDAALQTSLEAISEQATDESSALELQRALALLETYRERLVVIEARLAELEHEDETRIRTFVTQTIQTESRGDGGKSDMSSCPSCTTNLVHRGNSSAHTVHTTGPEAEINSIPSPPSPSPLLNEDSEHVAFTNSPVHLSAPGLRRERPTGENAPSGWDPLDQGLSSYVLLVGVGVCAIVIQTLFRRLAGKRA